MRRSLDLGSLHLRPLRLLLLALPITAAFAQGGPPPPPPLAPLQAPVAPPANPVTLAKANLGKALFWDEQLSSTRTVACGSCHQPLAGGEDPRQIAGNARATNPGNDGIAGTADDVLSSPGVQYNNADGSLAWSARFGLKEQVTPRCSPSYIDAGYSNLLFWDGRAGQTFLDPVTGDTLIRNGAALETQCAAPPASTTEMGHIGRDWPAIASRVAGVKPLALALSVPAALSNWIDGRSYPQLFQEAYGTSAVTPARIIMAIATYERTQWSGQTAYDSLNAGLPVTLTPQEAQGRTLFTTLPCGLCHGGALTADNLFHYTGVVPATQDSGRMAITHNPADLGAFRSPNLRNVALRKSFMHNGRFHTLREVVDFYNRGGDFPAPNNPLRPLGLNNIQLNALVAFMTRAFTDPRVASGSAPFDRPTLFSEGALVPQVSGQGGAGSGGSVPQAVAFEPALAGNPSFTLGVYSGLGGATATLVVDEHAPDASAIPASASFAKVVTSLAGSGNAAGYGSAVLAIPDDAALYGKTLYARWYVQDPAAANGLATSPLVQFKVFGAGGTGVLAVEGAPGVNRPRALQLFANRPNPFMGSTTIHYDLFSPSWVKVVLYDAQGRAIRRLVDAPLQGAGSYSMNWDGLDDSGRAVVGGVYFYRVDAGGTTATNRMVKLQ